MIKIFEGTDWEILEREVNLWIKSCGSKIHDIQFRTAMNEDGLMFHCCVITELNLHNH